MHFRNSIWQGCRIIGASINLCVYGNEGKMSVSLAKQHGIHYTPERLAEFLAKSILSNRKLKNPITVLDPACGDGGLLIAIYRMLSKRHRESAKFLGYERDEEAKVVAEQRLFEAGARHVKIHVQDFLEIDGMQDTEMPLFGSPRKSLPKVDIVISNPPYVRTQVIGAKKSQGLAKQFGLTGRVDLYHAFAFAMGMCLKPNGVLGLLTSNRFLTVKSGEKLRELLTSQFSIDSVFDLGDTKLFNAAVLPAIIVATKSENPGNKQAFDRIYESRNTSSKHRKIATSLWGVLGDRRVSAESKQPKESFFSKEENLRLIRRVAYGHCQTLSLDNGLILFADIRSARLMRKRLFESELRRQLIRSLSLIQLRLSNRHVQRHHCFIL